ncbi:MAG: hypothetical protein D3911_16195, partial [Candidatus Electrothrix sp. AW3_4]|nr:hypothetical protein [Candidatus Electrothrix gigas]
GAGVTSALFFGPEDDRVAGKVASVRGIRCGLIEGRKAAWCLRAEQAGAGVTSALFFGPEDDRVAGKEC